jgi:cyclophilin family peptidyl-prolyl cis-trans isomerase
MKTLYALAAVAMLTPLASAANPVVEMKTSMGTIKIELFEKETPITVKNFLKYVEDKHYDGTIFHRVIGDFMIQGGGFNKDMEEKKTRETIKNESKLSNTRGTIAMARRPALDSATAQFFINTADNSSKLDRPRYAVFGKVISGMDVVDKIKDVRTTERKGHSDVPVDPVVIESVRLVKAAGEP